MRAGACLIDIHPAELIRALGRHLAGPSAARLSVLAGLLPYAGRL